MASVTLKSVSKQFQARGRSVAFGVKDLDLTIRDGEFVSLVGPSGCGKSTTLHLIAGLEQPTGGDILIGDQVVTRASPRERDIAMVFQSYALYPHLSVRQNLAFPLEVQRVPREERERRVAEAAEMLGLEALLERRPAQLSGGQRQRVALGRALVRRPRAFLFDEPLSNLDAGLRTQMRSELKKLYEQLRSTFIYVTHDQAEAMTLSDRVVVMHQGRIEQVGSPREVYDAPASTFVASFFGTPRINLLDPSSLGLEAPASGLRAGIRAENLELGRGAPPVGAVEGRVYLVEPLGAEMWITVALASGDKVLVRTGADVDAPLGDRVWVRPLAAKLLWFDAETGKRK